ncbi:U3 small nucleolar ribonucleoprotein protein MPP10 [Episyrphus balteatus]|uniref:U3 small nucleolar ribonucleoprotein protein MPP10 n=1 Tax=Episyrphus balteatus TaxID=286459 RepID=UPI002485FD6A|nr:U3 small nucleolar ribonucleoprotein protein MPP10 [Episyrphus balteatus]
MRSVKEKPSKSSIIKSLSKNLKAVTTNTESFLRINPETSNKIRKLLQQTYNLTSSKDSSNQNSLDILPELIVDDLDAEQIWQLIELRNNVVWPQFLENTSKILPLKDEQIQIRYMSSANETEQQNDNDLENTSPNNSDLDNLSDHDFEESQVFEHESKKKFARKEKSSIVDDKFFKLSEMEEFLKAEDEKELKKQNGRRLKDDYSINLFADDFENEDEENVCYKDFFKEDDEAKTTSIKSKHTLDEFDQNNEDDDLDDDEVDNDDDDNDHDDDENEIEYQDANKDFNSETESIGNSDTKEKEKPKSSFEDRQERLNQRINDYEQVILGEKPWQLKGEINATNRPQNSLLEEILEFEATTRPAPIITEETTLRLEDIIRQRIKDQVWDDVELKIKPLQTAQEYRKQLVLNQEKSKESLAHIYEKEYQQEIEKLDPNAADAKEDEEPKSHKEIKEMMASLFVKLDALSNFHFTPKPVAPEPKIITNTPAINMEEVAPVAVSSAKLLAPEEIRKRNKSDILGSNERKKTDKNRERRHKKNKQKAIHKAIEEKNIQKQKMGIKLSKKEETASMTNKLTKRRNVEKITTSQDAGSMKSSKAFFSKLHETTMLQKKSVKNTKPDKNPFSAKKLKL